jgi:hypothetical protein
MSNDVAFCDIKFPKGRFSDLFPHPDGRIGAAYHFCNSAQSSGLNTYVECFCIRLRKRKPMNDGPKCKGGRGSKTRYRHKTALQKKGMRNDFQHIQ